MSKTEKLKNLVKLKEEGSISEVEFQRLKKEMLSHLESNTVDGNNIANSDRDSKAGSNHGDSEELKANSSPVQVAGHYIKKSVLFKLLLSASSFLALITFIVMLFTDIMPAIIKGQSWDYLGLANFLLLVFFVLTVIFWVKSLTTLHKAGRFLKDCNNTNVDFNKSSVKPVKRNKVNVLAIVTISLFIIFKLVGVSLLSILQILIAIAGIIMVLKHFKWSFLTGGLNIIIQFYFFNRFFVNANKIEGQSNFSGLIFHLIIILLLAIFTYSTYKYFKNSRSV